MKIRQSFVANSSSSSYLIVGIKDESDIDLSYKSSLESVYIGGDSRSLVGKVLMDEEHGEIEVSYNEILNAFTEAKVMLAKEGIHDKEVKLYCGERYC